jgi:histidine triad (HIT) family protein
MNTTDCIFCKIVRGEIPVNKIYENDHTIAFLDIKPVNPGHALVIPKEHHINIFDIPEAVLLNMTSTVKKIAVAMEKSLGIENMNVTSNNGKYAGQEVFHSHIHLVPRNETDGLKLWHGKSYEDGQAQKIEEKIKKALM